MERLVKDVAAEYPELWHYTTASGLKGILESQQLWATNVFYLNDAEEFIGFFDRKLGAILTEGVQAGIAEATKTPGGRKRLQSLGGNSKVVTNIPKEFSAILRNTSVNYPPYVTSFCTNEPGTNSHDGLLSQWRGYGHEGGYAIIFDTEGLNQLLKEEQANYQYSMGIWGDVDYFQVSNAANHAETLAWEQEVKDLMKEMILDWNPKRNEQLFNPIMSLAMRHKHQGFREEREVRVAVIPANDELIEESRKAGNSLSKKPIRSLTRQGVLVPYLSLFEPLNGVALPKLPIKKIIVGPHHDKLQRRNSVELLLKQVEISAEVLVSDIPFIGR